MANEITAAQWSKFKDPIIRMRRKGVKVNGPNGIVARMEREHGFRTSHCQMELQLSKWQERKNLSRLEWCRILRVVDHYHELGKRCLIRMNGELLSKGKLDKKRRLYRTTPEYRKAQGVSEDCLPECITVDVGPSLTVYDTQNDTEEPDSQGLSTIGMPSAAGADGDRSLALAHTAWDASMDLTGVERDDSNSHWHPATIQDPDFEYLPNSESVVECSAMPLAEPTQTDALALPTTSNDLLMVGSNLPDLLSDGNLSFQTLTPLEQRIWEMYALPSPILTQEMMVSNNRYGIMEGPSGSHGQSDWLPYQDLYGTSTLSNLTQSLVTPSNPQNLELQLSEDLQTVLRENESVATGDASARSSSMKARLVALLPPDSAPVTALLDRRNVALEQAFALPLYRILISSIENNFAGLNNVPTGEVFKLLKQDMQMRSRLVQYLQQTPKAVGAALVEKLLIAAIEEQDAATVTELLGTRLANIDEIVCTFEGKRYSAIQRSTMLPNPELFWSLLNAGADPRKSFDHAVSILCLALKTMQRHQKVNMAMVDALISHKIDVRLDVLLLAIELRDRVLIHRLLRRYLSLGQQLRADHSLANDARASLLSGIIENLDEPFAIEVISRMDLGNSSKVWTHGFDLTGALILATRKGFLNVIQWLLPISQPRAVPLAVAVQQKDERLIERLLMYCIDSAMKPCIIQDAGRGTFYTTPFAEAIRTKVAKYIALFENHPIWRDICYDTTLAGLLGLEATLLAACEVGNLPMCQKLVEHVHAIDRNEVNLTYIPYGYVHPQEVQLSSVLSIGLQAAVENGYEHIALYLLDAGSPIIRFGHPIFKFEENRSHLNSAKLLDPRKHCLFQALQQGRQCLFERLMEITVTVESRIGAPCIAYALKNRIEWAVKALFIMRPIQENLYLLEVLKEATRLGVRSEFFRCVQDYNLPFDIHNSACGKFAIVEAIGIDDLQTTQRILKSEIDLREMVQIALNKLQELYRMRPNNDSTLPNKSISMIFRAFSNKYPQGVRGLGADGLHLAIESGNLALLEEMLQANFDVDMIVPERLEKAVAIDDLENRQTIRPKGLNALGAAIKNPVGRRLQMVRRILEAGAKVNFTVSIGRDNRRTALCQSILTGDLALVQLVIDFGANIHETAEHGRAMTALQHACYRGSTKLVNLLLNLGVDVNEAPAYRGGRTALQLCAKNGHIGTALKLLRRGADIHAAPAMINGRTPLQAAAEYGRLDMISWLWKAAGNRRFSLENCNKAMKLAETSGHIACRDLIKELIGKD